MTVDNGDDYVVSQFSTLAQQKALVLVPRCAAGLSLCCSGFIIAEVALDYYQNKKHRHRNVQNGQRGSGSGSSPSPIQRALVGMSLFDCLSSLGFFLSSWLLPTGFIWGATGNVATCNLSGFFVLTGCGTPMFNSTLALFSLLIIKYRYSDARLAQLEPYIYTFIVVWALGFPTAMVGLDMMRPSGSTCFPAETLGCQQNGYQTHDGLNPLTGEPCPTDEQLNAHAWIFVTVFFYGPVYASFIIVTAALALIYQQVRKTHLRMQRYTFHRPSLITSQPLSDAASGTTACRSTNSTSIWRSLSFSRPTCSGGRRSSTNGDLTIVATNSHLESRSREELRRIAMRALLYSSAFVFHFVPGTVWSAIAYQRVTPFWVVVTALATTPLQGFTNLVIFLRDRPSSQTKLWRLLTCGLIKWSAVANNTSRSRSKRRPGSNQSLNDRNADNPIEKGVADCSPRIEEAVDESKHNDQSIVGQVDKVSRNATNSSSG